MNDDRPMKAHAWGLTAGLALICALEAVALLRPPPRPPVLAAAPRPEVHVSPQPLPEALRGDTAFTATMTPDDVARGIDGLLALPPDDPLSPTAEQRAALVPLADRGWRAKEDQGLLKLQRRMAELAWAKMSAELAAELGPERIAAMRPEQAPASLQPVTPEPAKVQPRPGDAPAPPPGPPHPPERR